MERRHVLRILGVVLLAGALFSLGMAVDVSSERSLSQLETTLFGILTLVLSLLGSALLAALFGRRQAREEYVQLARPALRRAVELLRSAGQITDAIRAKQPAVGGREKLSPEVVSEWLDSVERLVKQHSGQLGAAIADWQDILPEEYEEIVNLADLVSEYQDKIAELEELHDEQSARGQTTRERLEKEIAKLRKDIQESNKYTFPTTPPITVSGLDDLISAYNLNPSVEMITRPTEQQGTEKQRRRIRRKPKPDSPPEEESSSS